LSVRQEKGGEAKVGAQVVEGRRRGEEFQVGGRCQGLIGVQGEQGVPPLHGDRQDAPLGGAPPRDLDHPLEIYLKGTGRRGDRSRDPRRRHFYRRERLRTAFSGGRGKRGRGDRRKGCLRRCTDSVVSGGNAEPATRK